jgi:hypothetical protein
MKILENTFMQKIIDTLTKHSLWFIIAMIIGGYFATTATKTFYTNKMDETIKVQAFIYKGIVYNVTPK